MLTGGLGVLLYEKCFAVIWSTLQQFPWLYGMACRGKCCFSLFMVHTPCSLLDFMYWLQGGKCWNSYGSLSSSLLGYMDWLAEESCKCSWSTVCLSAGSWEMLEMQSLVETWGCPNADVLADCVFQDWFSLNTWGLLQGSASCFSGLVSFCQWRGLSWPGCLWLFFYWLGKFSFSLSVP